MYIYFEEIFDENSSKIRSLYGFFYEILMEFVGEKSKIQ